MVTQTYDDWRRMLTAVGTPIHADGEPVAASIFLNGGADLMVEYALKKYDAEDIEEPYVKAVQMQAIATALGIHKRRRLAWPLSASCRGTTWVAVGAGNLKAAVCPTGVRNEWEGKAFEEGQFDDIARVSGHPSRDSAIEHLERLLGRDA